MAKMIDADAEEPVKHMLKQLEEVKLFLNDYEGIASY